MSASDGCNNKFAICVDKTYYLATIDNITDEVVPYFTGRGRTLSRDFFFLEKNRKKQYIINLSTYGLCCTNIRINRYVNSLRDNNSVVMEYVENFPVFYPDNDFVFDCELWEGKELYIENNGSMFRYNKSVVSEEEVSEEEMSKEEVSEVSESEMSYEEISCIDESNGRNLTFIRSRSATPLQRRVNNKNVVDGENYDIYDWGEDYSKVRNTGIAGSSNTVCDYIYMFASMLLVCSLYIFILSSGGVVAYSKLKN
jgi:hypothetical protein